MIYGELLTDRNYTEQCLQLHMSLSDHATESRVPISMCVRVGCAINIQYERDQV